jgi:dienelactone hydrolase
MRFTSETSSGGVATRLFTLGEIPGVLWTPEQLSGTPPLILLGHGGGQHKQAPGLEARARRFVADGGFAVAAVDAPAHGGRPRTDQVDRIVARLRGGGDVAPVLVELHTLLAEQSVPEWRAVLDALPEHLGAGPVGYWGMSLGCGLGVPLIAAEPRIRAAVLGLNGDATGAAARITVPVEFLVQWDDQLVPRAASLALFDRFASAEKTLHANPGGHGEVPAFEVDSSIRFFSRHLS